MSAENSKDHGAGVVEMSTSRQPRQISCALCQKRKVKCDKKQPCSYCIKAGVSCIPATRAPRRPRTRITNLISRLNQYERYMKEHGIKIDDEDTDEEDDGDDDNESSDEDSHTPESNAGRQKGGAAKKTTLKPIHGGKLIIDPVTGKSRYIDRHAWDDMSEELEKQVESSKGPLGTGVTEDFFWKIMLLFPQAESAEMLREATQPDHSLCLLHPPPVYMFKLWQIFLDNVYPIVKLFHAPTVQKQLLAASTDLINTPYDFQALMFSLYICALKSIVPSDCPKLFGEELTTLEARFRSGAETALLKARFLVSASVESLQAFVLFIVAIRSFLNGRETWFLSGIAIRLAQRLRLHLDGSALGMSTFETQVRRRIWWTILVIDGRMSEIIGVGLSLANYWTTKPPLNLNDSDLSPEMTDTPSEHRGLTEVSFLLLACDISRFSRVQSTSTGFDGFFSKFDTIPLAKRDEVIKEFESHVEEKYMRFLDRSIPLHCLIATTIQQMICKMKITAHHPRLSRKGAQSQKQRDFLFANSLEAMRLECFSQAESILHGFKWHMFPNFQLDAFVYLLSELQRRTIGEEVERAWKEVDGVYFYRPLIITFSNNPLFYALGSLTLKAWACRKAELEKIQPNQRYEIPDCVQKLEASRKNGNEFRDPSADYAGCGVAQIAMKHQSRAESTEPTPPASSSPFNPSMTTGFGQTFTAEASIFDPGVMDLDWGYWDELLRPGMNVAMGYQNQYEIPQNTMSFTNPMAQAGLVSLEELPTEL